MHFDYLLILLFCITFLGIGGVLLVFWQYIFKKRGLQANKTKRSTAVPHKVLTGAATSKRVEPNLGIPGLAAVEVRNGEEDISSHVAPKANRVGWHTVCNQPNDLVVLYLLAAQHSPYEGARLVQVFQAAGLHYGPMRIFHYCANGVEPQERLFSVASAIEPGIFDLAQISRCHYPGLCLFMPKAHCQDTTDAFRQMLQVAQQLERDLGGTLCDHARQPLDRVSTAL